MNTLSWHLNKNINNVRNLFSQIDLPYELDCFVCSCGHNEIIIKDQYTILENYSCKHCDNKEFYDANYHNNLYYQSYLGFIYEDNYEFVNNLEMFDYLIFEYYKKG